MGDNAIEVVHLAKNFGGIHALRDVNMTVPRGEITAIIGDNGAGKSTLIKCLSGDHVPDSGTIYVDGKEREISNPLASRQFGIETVYQDLAMINSLSVADNLFLSRELTFGVPPFKILRNRTMKIRAQQMLDDVGTPHIPIDSELGWLSGGQRQAVAIARAVSWGAQILILDEPTAAMGVRESNEVHLLLKSLREKGLTILFISHNFEEVLGLADQIWVMRQGQAVANVRGSETSGVELVALVTGATTGSSGD